MELKPETAFRVILCSTIVAIVGLMIYLTVDFEDYERDVSDVAAVSSSSEKRIDSSGSEPIDDPVLKVKEFRRAQQAVLDTRVAQLGLSTGQSPKEMELGRLRYGITRAVGGSTEETKVAMEIFAKADRVKEGSASFSEKEFRALESMVLSFYEIRGGRKTSESYPEEFLTALEAIRITSAEVGFPSRIDARKFDAMYDEALMLASDKRVRDRVRQLFSK